MTMTSHTAATEPAALTSSAQVSLRDELTHLPPVGGEVSEDSPVMAKTSFQTPSVFPHKANSYQRQH